MNKLIRKNRSKTKRQYRFLGNENNSGFFKVQPKLDVGTPDDRFEREADNIADKVVNNSFQDNSFFRLFPFLIIH